MRLGVMSDTHNHLANTRQIVALLNDARVDRVVHTGDITQPKTLELLAALEAPLFGVYGNNDLERDALEAACRAHGHHFVEPPLRVEWHGRRILVVHDPTQLDDALLAEVEIALHGHDHTHTDEQRHGARVFNPGECAGHMRGYNQIGVIDLETVCTEILRF
jgi:putative phosphoesterase